MPLSRRQFLATLGAFALTGAYMRLGEPQWLELTQKQIPLRDLKAPLRLLHLSDLHAFEETPLELIEEAIERGLALKPHFACITGDFISWKLHNEEAYTQALRRLSQAVPTFACLGNHDGGPWAGASRGYPSSTRVRQLLANAGIRLLVNERIDIELNGAPLTLIGLGDLYNREFHPELCFPEQRAQTTIVLSHNPDTKETLFSYDWDLMLSGHTHGGQLIVPLLGLRPFLPVRDRSFPEGLRSWADKHVHITRGVGTLHGLRFNCRPEVSLLELGDVA